MDAAAIISGIKQAGEVGVALVGVGFTIYNTYVGQMNRRQLISHKTQIEDLQVAAAPAAAAATKEGE